MDELNRSIEETQKRMRELEDKTKETAPSENREEIDVKKEMNRTSGTCRTTTKY